MTDKKTEALKLALEAFEADASNENFLVLKHCVREALAEQTAQQQEPAAVARVDDLERGGRVHALAMGLGLDAPLYTTPPQRKPLTDEQIGMAFRKAFPVGGVVFTNGAIDFARNIEAAHGIKGDA